MASKKNRVPINMVWRRLRDEQGRPIMALTAMYAADRNICEERGYGEGVDVRAELTKVRNIKFHRLAHAMGKLAVQSLDEFATASAHSALKKLQERSGVCCVEMRYELPGIGTFTRREPESIAFDSMTEERFHEFWNGICAYVRDTYWPELTAEGVGELAEMLLQQETR